MNSAVLWLFSVSRVIFVASIWMPVKGFYLRCFCPELYRLLVELFASFGMAFWSSKSIWLSFLPFRILEGESTCHLWLLLVLSPKSRNLIGEDSDWLDSSLKFCCTIVWVSLENRILNRRFTCISLWSQFKSWSASGSASAGILHLISFPGITQSLSNLAPPNSS